jgi:hypothetical protein
MTAAAVCAWCGRAFAPRVTGGRAQRYCNPRCRRAYDAAGRRWVAEATAAGALTVKALRSGYAATRALLPAGLSPGVDYAPESLANCNVSGAP